MVVHVDLKFLVLDRALRRVDFKDGLLMQKGDAHYMLRVYSDGEKGEILLIHSPDSESEI